MGSLTSCLLQCPPEIMWVADFYLTRCRWKTFIVHQNFVSWDIYSIGICEISHQTFGPSHRKCPTCLTFFAYTVDTLGPEQNSWHFVGNMFKCILLNEKLLFYVISLEFASESPIGNKKCILYVPSTCHQATSHYLNQWCPCCPTPLDVIGSHCSCV